MRPIDPDKDTVRHLVQAACEEAYLAHRDSITKCVLCGAAAAQLAASLPADPSRWAGVALGIGEVQVHVYGLCEQCIHLPDWGDRAQEKRRERWGSNP